MNPEVQAILTAGHDMVVTAITIGACILLATAASLIIALLALRK